MTQFSDLDVARAYAQANGLREKAVCQITRHTPRGVEVLVFDHVPALDSGVQVVAGGLEIGETPEQAALREAQEETGQTGFTVVSYLGSAEWINDAHAKREMRHFYHLTAPDHLPDTWDHPADDHVFRFRWEPLPHPRIDWDMDLFLPQATLTELTPSDVKHDKEMPT